MAVSPITCTYPFDGRCAMNVDHEGQEYRVCWDGDWRSPPDFSNFPDVDAAVTHIPHSKEVGLVWSKTRVLKYGGDSHIRILHGKKDEYPVCKVAINDRKRRLIQDEFSILCNLAANHCPVVRIQTEPLADEQGVFGFWMEELLEIGSDEGGNFSEQIKDAVMRVHGCRVIHYDLSPSNIMRTKEGRVKLIDFGRAGYLGDEIPNDKLRPKSNNDKYAIEQDSRSLKRVLGMMHLTKVPLFLLTLIDIYDRKGVTFIPRQEVIARVQDYQRQDK
jgi:hypothetical protein